MKDNNYFMTLAIEEAKKAKDKHEVPVGAIIVKDGKVIARAHNLKETLNDPTAHAEVLCIKEACKYINNWRLTGCHMYVTLEPCPMCAGAIINSRISKLYIGAVDSIAGACGSVLNVAQNDYLNSYINIEYIISCESSNILKEFFGKKRREVKK